MDLHFILDDANSVVPVWMDTTDETNPNYIIRNLRIHC